MELSKTASEALMQKIAAADQTDQANAIDVGFARACEDMGMSPVQTQKLAKVAREKLDKFAGENGIPGGEHHGSGNPQASEPEGEGQDAGPEQGTDNKGSSQSMNTGAHHSNGDNSSARVGATSGPAKTPAGK
jgi:hypothetical protein